MIEFYYYNLFKKLSGVIMIQHSVCCIAFLPNYLLNEKILKSNKLFTKFGMISNVSICDDNCIRSKWQCIHIRYFSKESAEKTLMSIHMVNI